MRVCLIGAGTSGLSVLRAFKCAKDKGEDVPEVVCFEKQDRWGGLWNYSWRTGTDQYGDPQHFSMYRYLFSNGPKECLEFADYTFEEHFGKPIASYPPRPVLLDYISGRANKTGIRDQIRFNTKVVSCVYEDGKFTVRVKNLLEDKEYKEVFDYVVVAIGHFSTPNYPSFPGLDSFKGRVLHSHDFRESHEFKDKDVLVVGTSYSAEDIASQCWKFGCKSVTISHRTKPTGFKWPDCFKEVPLLEKVDGNTCTFKDGSTKDVDAIILCTGYQYYFPFLERSLVLKQPANRVAIVDLYKGVAFVNNTKLFYMGMQDQYFSYNMFDVQAWWIRDAILGKIKIPDDKEVLMADVRKRLDEGTGLDCYGEIYYQRDYIKELLAESDYPKFDVDGMGQAFVKWEDDKKENIMTFRDKSFKSLLTGTMSPIFTPWVDAKDDSIAAYVGK